MKSLGFYRLVILLHSYKELMTGPIHHSQFTVSTHRFQGKGVMLFEKIHEAERKVSALFATSVKDKFNMKYLEKYKTSQNINLKHLYFFYLLHAIIIPPRVSKSAKPSISDAQEDMIIHLVNLNNFSQKEDELLQHAIEGKYTLQPRIFAVGETMDNIKEFYVFFSGIRYKLETLLDAVNLVMKICYVFNLKYSAKSKYVWIFLHAMKKL